MTHEALQFVPVTAAQRREVVVISHALGDSELEQAKAACGKLALERSLVGPSGLLKHNKRDSEVAWVANDEHSRWLFLLLMQRVQEANVFFGLDIWGFAEPLQYSEYGVGGNYCWHMDSGIDVDEKPRPPRKVSFTLQLSDGDEYEGGDLQFLVTDWVNAPRDLGTMILFPSYTTHRVNFVTRGKRRSLVGWASGPDLR